MPEHGGGFSVRRVVIVSYKTSLTDNFRDGNTALSSGDGSCLPVC